MRPALSAFRIEHAVQRAQVLLRQRHARENIAQVDAHGAALFLRPEELDLVELALQVLEESRELLLGRRRRFRGLGEGQIAADALQPLIGENYHRLREVERSEGRVDRQRDDGVGKPDLRVLQPDALAPEHQRHRLAGGDARRHGGGGLVGAEHGLGLVVRARGGGEHVSAVGNGAARLS